MTNQIRTTAHYFEDDIGGERPCWAVYTMNGNFMLFTDCASCSDEDFSSLLDERELSALTELHCILTKECMKDAAKKLAVILENNGITV